MILVYLVRFFDVLGFIPGPGTNGERKEITASEVTLLIVGLFIGIILTVMIYRSKKK